MIASDQLLNIYTDIAYRVVRCPVDIHHKYGVPMDEARRVWHKYHTMTQECSYRRYFRSGNYHDWQEWLGSKDMEDD